MITLTVLFVTDAYANSLLTFALIKKKVHHFHLPQFDFVGSKILNKGKRISIATISLTFQRRTGYYILQIYVPSMFLTLLSWLGFLMKSTDIADRVALQITMILSIVVLHGGTNTSLPPVSYAKASDWFVIVSFGFILLALLETMLVYRISPLMKRRESERNLSVSFLFNSLNYLLLRRLLSVFSSAPASCFIGQLCNFCSRFRGFSLDIKIHCHAVFSKLSPGDLSSNLNHIFY